MKKKILISLIVLLSISIIGSFVFYKKVLVPIRGDWSLILKQKHKKIYALYGLFRNFDHGTNKLLNDYNINFLPITERLNLNFTKIKIDGIERSQSRYLDKFMNNFEQKYLTFFISKNDNNIFLGSGDGKIFFSDVNKLTKNDFKTLEHNLDTENIIFRDIIVNNKNIYISANEKKNDDCSLLQVYKAEIVFNEKLNFEGLFLNNECVDKVAGGRMQLWKENNRDKILLTTSHWPGIGHGENDPRPQDDNSIFGKVLIIDEETGNFEIFSKGHRNSIGLYANLDDNVILNTENGPKGGDEINFVQRGKNYGWDIASYGKKYKNKNNEVDYKQSHEDYGFEEPIFSFIPSIGICEIIKVPNDFAESWQNNYIVASLLSSHLYRVKFDKKFSKIIYMEEIYIGERIRDLLYLDNSKKILLALEDTGSIGVLDIQK